MRALAAIVGFLVTGIPLATAQHRSRTEGDSRAEAQIRRRLHTDPDLKHDRIDVRVKNRLATLRGVVDSQAERAKADELAHVEGIDSVKNELRGGRSDGAMQSVMDASISSTLKTQYAADERFKRTHIAVTTTNGVVILSGTVPSEAVHRIALEVVHGTSGVKGTKDKLQVVRARARASTKVTP